MMRSVEWVVRSVKSMESVKKAKILVVKSFACPIIKTLAQ